MLEPLLPWGGGLAHGGKCQSVFIRYLCILCERASLPCFHMGGLSLVMHPGAVSSLGVQGIGRECPIVCMRVSSTTPVPSQLPMMLPRLRVPMYGRARRCCDATELGDLPEAAACLTRA